MDACPNCSKELQIPEVAYRNADQYGRSCVTVTRCCGAGVRMTPVRSYRISAYQGREDQDDWGNKLKANRPNHLITQE